MFLIVLDFEGVVVKNEFLLELAKIAGNDVAVERLTHDGIEGRLRWSEALKRRLKLLKGVERTKCLAAARKLELYEGVEEFVDSLRKLGNFKIGIITGCFDIAVNPIKEKLHLDFAVSNKLVFNNNRLSGAEILVDEDKDFHMARVAEYYGVKKENVIAVGDGANDVTMVSKAGLGIGFNPAPILEKYAKINLHSNRLDEVLPYIREFVKEKQRSENSTLSAEQEKLKVLICDSIDEHGVKLLESFGFEVTFKPQISYENLKEEVQNYHILIVRSRTKVTKEIIEAGKNLKIIARAGAGVDNIDVEYAETKGIRIICASEAVTTAVAELTIGLIISLARKIPSADRAMKEERWTKSEIEGWELCGKNIGIIGFGRIGQKVAQLARAFGMRIMVSEINGPPEDVLKKLNAELMPLQELLRRSDVVTIHVTLTPQTRHIIGEKEIQQMKKGAYLINTSRGPVIDEGALLEALKNGKIAGAALDVYEKEPPTDYSLAKLPNVICTPHIGAQTIEAQENASIYVAKRIIEIFKKSPKTTCNFKCRECSEY